MYERVRHVPMEEPFNIADNGNIGSFFFTSATYLSIHLDVDAANYENLRRALDQFIYISKLAIRTNRSISLFTAKRIVSAIQNLSRPNSTLSVIVNQNSYDVFKLAAGGKNNLSIMPHSQRITKRMPSPLRDVFKKLKEYCSEENDARSEAKNFIPASLSKQNIIRSAYKKNSLDDLYLLPISTKDDVDTAINNVAPNLLESIICFKDNWVFVTQFEVYYRNNKDIDSCALVTTSNKYYETPTATIKTKSEKGNTWYELSVFWKRFEFLVTGGVTGSNESSNIIQFLGPSISFIEMLSLNSNSTTKMLQAETEVAFVVQERNLRDWAKNGASYKWSCISKRFFEKGFFQMNPLRINDPKNSLYKLISKMLLCICRKEYGYDDNEQCFQLTKQLPQVIQLSQRRKNNLESIMKELKSRKIKYDTHVLSCLIKLNNHTNEDPASILTPDEIVKLTSKLSSYCKNQNKKALKFYNF
ncbi:hypothetical protein RMATCC62417_16942 [Rhizopus microsporus]|nr:hypothetical protein RMATCC62417_16942 [Rhizopus microsporus]